MGQTEHYLTVKQFVKLIETLKREEGLSDDSLIMFESLSIVNARGGVNTYYDVFTDEVVKSEVVVGEDGTFDDAVLGKYRRDGEKWAR
ncbi:hypothetical protein Pisl_1277 [Pyrobaculum islandicum DSM 4184]|uniref:Uncharacterized protein n=1 Tax=Pyrobaculum islandicum (strain DSM 4184 / JCM 9189 / GEO3) TaxID=384616 RepID=A1RU09_PYRIL|nr:hypothetical protein [Pyrobaculum islandicum]ABL88441.1 hypothetical protein Pisl_1277 [Pyrobaculum islandicum DSM 4184]